MDAPCPTVSGYVIRGEYLRVSGEYCHLALDLFWAFDVVGLVLIGSAWGTGCPCCFAGSCVVILTAFSAHQTKYIRK
jgi:hypothetical protein